MLAVAADALVVLHLVFIAFVLLGALLVLRWPWLAVLHVPAFLWGAWIEFFSGICPLTPLEQRLRVAAGEAGYGCARSGARTGADRGGLPLSGAAVSIILL